MRRRNFLKLCGAAGLGFAAPVGQRYLACAEEEKAELPPYEGPYYVVLNASGGWDTTYIMDPKGVNEINRLYQQGDITLTNCWSLMVSIIQSTITLLARDTWRPASLTLWNTQLLQHW